MIGSGPAGASAAYYLLIAGHDVTIYERDEAPGGMLRYGIPEYRLPKERVLRPRVREHHPARRALRVQPGAGTRLQPGRPPEPGLRRGGGGDRLLRHEQARHPRRGRGRRDRRPGVPQDRHARPAVPGPRRHPGGRGRRRLHVDGLLAHVGAPGCVRGDARLPPGHEGHAGLGRGPRGDRGRRHHDLPGRPDPRPRRRRRQGDRRGVHPDAAGRARRLGPAPPGAGSRHGVRDRMRPGPPRDRPGAGPDLDRRRARTASRRPGTAACGPMPSRS